MLASEQRAFYRRVFIREHELDERGLGRDENPKRFVMISRPSAVTEVDVTKLKFSTFLGNSVQNKRAIEIILSFSLLSSTFMLIF